LFNLGHRTDGKVTARECIIGERRILADECLDFLFVEQDVNLFGRQKNCSNKYYLGIQLMQKMDNFI
jgi:hypothetical protein